MQKHRIQAFSNTDRIFIFSIRLEYQVIGTLIEGMSNVAWLPSKMERWSRTGTSHKGPLTKEKD